MTDDTSHDRNSLSSIDSNLIRERDENVSVWSFYKEQRLLGKGSMGDVHLVKRKSGTAGGSAYPDASPKSDKDQRRKRGIFKKLLAKPKKSAPAIAKSTSIHGEQYALKSIHLLLVGKVYRDELRNEIDILKSLDHPSIAKAYEVYESPQNIWLVMEYCSGGDLYARAPYSESQAADVVSQICSAIAYMHSRDMVHRDIKMENIMFESKEPTAKIRVLDFGLSNKINPSSVITMGNVGTQYTMSPQELDGTYDDKADCWAIGVIAFLMLCHEKPFKGKRKAELTQNIKNCRYDFKAHNVTQKAKDFVASLLVHDPEERSSAAAAAEHPWMKAPQRLTTEADATALRELMSNTRENILSYAKSSELQRMAAVVVAHKSSFAEIADMRQAFEKFDENKDGVVSMEEFLAALSEFNYTEKEMTDMFSQMDVNNDGVIMYTEFLAATLQMNGRIEELRLAEAFDHIDDDGSGFISKEELVKLLGKNTPTIEKLIKEADTDGDGMISFEEFRRMFRDDHCSAAKQTLAGL